MSEGAAKHPHTEDCRKRMEGRMEDEGDRRVERYKSRLEERMREELGEEDGRKEEEGTEGRRKNRIQAQPAVSDRMRATEERGELDMEREEWVQERDRIDEEEWKVEAGIRDPGRREEGERSRGPD